MSDLSRTGALSPNYSGDSTVFPSTSAVNTFSTASDGFGRRPVNSVAVPSGNSGASGLLEDVFADVFASIASQFHSVDGDSTEPAESEETTVEAKSVEETETSNGQDRDEESTRDQVATDGSLLSHAVTQEQADHVVVDEQTSRETVEVDPQIDSEESTDDGGGENHAVAADQNAQIESTSASGGAAELGTDDQSGTDTNNPENLPEDVDSHQINGNPQHLDETELIRNETLPALVPREKSVGEGVKSAGTENGLKDIVDPGAQKSEGTAPENVPSERVERRRYRNHEQRPHESGLPAEQAIRTHESVSNAHPEQIKADSSARNTGSAAALAGPTTASPLSNSVDSITAVAASATSQNTPQAKASHTAARSAASVGTTDAVSGLAETNGPAEKAPAPGVAVKKSETRVDVVSRVKLVQRVSRAFQHLGPEGGVVRLKLAPAELGSVQVEMRVESKKVNARVVAETEAAAAALREHLPDLRSRLESFGMQVEQLEVETESFGGSLSSGFDGSDDRQQPFDAPGQRSSNKERLVSRSSEETNSATAVPVSRHVVPSGVDIRV